MNPGPGDLQRAAEASLWPLVESVVQSYRLAGLAVAVVRDGEVALCRGFGVRNLVTGEPVTPETMFHLASVSKSFVATAVLEMATPRRGRTPVLRLDAPVVEWVPEFILADGRAEEVTVRHLLTHTSGLPDVVDYEWHRPQLGDDALRDFVLSLSSSRLTTSPGAEFSYCNAGFEVLGHLLSVVTGQTFEAAVKQLVLERLGMHQSTFLRGDVPPELAASPHVGAPLTVPDGSYPYTRRHAPSSTLHSNLVELCRWMLANLEATGSAGPGGGPNHLDADMLDQMWTRAAPVGHPPWMEAAGLGWFLGSYRGHRTVSHHGADPGFGSKLVLVPEQRTGVVVLANSNTAPTSAVVTAALDLALGVRDDHGQGVPDPGDAPRLEALLPPVVGPLAKTLAEFGPDAAIGAYRQLTSAQPTEFDLDDEGFEDAVWGAIELHRSDLVWPILRLWTDLRPESSRAWTMSGWAHQVDGLPESGTTQLRRAVELDPDNDEAALLLRTPPSMD